MDCVLRGLLIYPFFLSFESSFLSVNILMPENTKFIGLTNWITVVTDFTFWKSLFNVVFNQVIFVSLSFVIGLGLALLLNEIKFLSSMFRTIMFIPVVTSITVAMIIFDFVSGPSGQFKALWWGRIFFQSRCSGSLKSGYQCL